MTTRIKQERIAQWQRDLLQRHQLGSAYLDAAREWFDPLANSLAQSLHQTGHPVLVALNGCQGSGKTTVSDYLCTALNEEHGLNAISLSLDDFYLTHNERQELAASVHPLLATRGVPGTHDMKLLLQTLAQLLSATRSEPVQIPRFNKATDDRHPAANWDRIAAPVDLVLLEGWCLGARPQSADVLSRPLNELEREEDPRGEWRSYSNNVLRQEFPALYALIDQWIMLRAPSFSCVHNWRWEQERKLAATLAPELHNRLLDDVSLRRFIQHFERITRDCLSELPQMVNHLFSLDEQRRVTEYQYQAGAGLVK